MNRFQLWSRDEYGQSSILASLDDFREGIEQGKKIVHGINVDNALTIDDKKRNWEGYFPIIESKIKQYVYGGKDVHEKDIAYEIKKDDLVSVPITELTKCIIKMYLGKLDGLDWYAENAKQKQIDSLSDINLQGKTVYFIRKIK